MGLFDDLLGKVSERIKRPESQSGLVEGISDLLTNKETGGLRGLIDSFKQKGLEKIINSWVGTGENAVITPEQIQTVLGNETVRNLAEKAGISMDDVKAHLAELLPQVVDKVTPEGKVPEGGVLEKGEET